MKGTIFIVSSPSGAGKSSLLRALFEEHNNDGTLYMSVSHTTRPMRPGEKDGVDYHFVSEAEFKQLIDRNAFYEWAHVFDKYYGTSREFVRANVESGRDVFLDIDWQGAQQVRKLEPDVKSIFILPPSLEELKRRLISRAQDSEEVINKRMAKAQREISHYTEYDYVIVNDVFSESLDALWGIVNASRHSLENQQLSQKYILDNLLSGYSE